MSFRKLLLTLGVIFIVAGLALSAAWMRQMSAPAGSGKAREVVRPARLVAMRDLQTGTLLRPDDFGWKELVPGHLPGGGMMRGQTNDADYLGAVTRRPFAAGEVLVATELVKPSDKRFLAAVLRPNHRAVSMAVDAAQTSSGLMLAGDYVDVILIQNFGDNVARTGRQSVAETILRNVRVVAVDHNLGPQTKAAADGSIVAVEARVPKTITLEVTEAQGHALFVAIQIGKIHFAVRALAGSGIAHEEERDRPEPKTWASNISPALQDLSQRHAVTSWMKAWAAMRKGLRPAKGLAHEDKRPGTLTITPCIPPNSSIVNNVRTVPGSGCFW